MKRPSSRNICWTQTKPIPATLKLGEASTTGDAEGDIIDTARSDIAPEEFQAACTALTGNIRQVPPMFSALKHEGKPLYEYARKGIVIERKPRDITIIRLMYWTLPHRLPPLPCVAARGRISAH